MSWTRIFNNPVCCCIFSVLRWVPVFFICGVIAWSYYAFVVQLCIHLAESAAEQAILLVLYHIILSLFLWSYWRCAMAPVGRPSGLFAISDQALEQLTTATPSAQRSLLEMIAKDMPVATRAFDGSIRYCQYCKVIKPDRCHHCSVCNSCVLKMDHHCPWVNTCVSWGNYKFFLLFLGYAFVYCLFVAMADLKYFIRFWTDNLAAGGTLGKFHIMFLFFVACMFAFSVACLFFYHLWLTAKNRTTIENFRAPVFQSGPDPNGFNLGCAANYQEVFGDRPRFWFLPIFSSLGNGVQFPIRTFDVECESLLGRYDDEKSDSGAQSSSPAESGNEEEPPGLSDDVVPFTDFAAATPHQTTASAPPTSRLEADEWSKVFAT